MVDKKYTWDDIAARDFRGYRIFLDIDGILMADGEDTVAENIKEYALNLKANNDVRIVSNAFRKSRCRHASELLAIPWVDSPYKKPSTRILRYIEATDKPLIVIGDKFLTDGIFAWRIGAEGILLQRRTSKKDRWFIRPTYWIDDIAFYIIRKISKLF